MVHLNDYLILYSMFLRDWTNSSSSMPIWKLKYDFCSILLVFGLSVKNGLWKWNYVTRVNLCAGQVRVTNLLYHAIYPPRNMSRISPVWPSSSGYTIVSPLLISSAPIVGLLSLFQGTFHLYHQLLFAGWCQLVIVWLFAELDCRLFVLWLLAIGLFIGT